MLETTERQERPALTPTTLLSRAPRLGIFLDSSGEVEVEVDGQRAKIGPSALAILDAFAHPRPLGEVLEKLGARGPEQWLESSTTVLQLWRAGALVSGKERPIGVTRGYVRPAVHVSMLEDRARTLGFCNALRSILRPDDVVVDVGTGTGVLSVCAAQIARHVYAIEASGIADLARKVFEANGVAHKVTLVRGRSTDVDLPERGTVLVTEMIGDDPLDEDLLEVIRDARRRLLVDGARVVPESIRLLAMPVDVPVDVLEMHSFTDRQLSTWKSDYGVDFAPLAAHKLGPSNPILVSSRNASGWRDVAPPALLADIDLRTTEATTLDVSASFEARVHASHLGVLVGFSSTLAPGIELSTVLGEVSPSNHWFYPLFPAANRPEVQPDERVELHYRYSRGRTRLDIR